MIPLQPLANHLWQSTLCAAVAGLLTLTLRKNRAQTRYWLWLAASVKFLIPFSLLVAAGSHLGRRTVAPAIPQSAVTVVIEQASQPFAAPAPLLSGSAAGHPTSANWIPAILYAVWSIGFMALVSSWWRRWQSLRATLRTASPLHLPINIEVRTSPAFAEPGVFGIRRPVLLLPTGITSHLTPSQLEAILAHELCHVRRRDNLATTIHMAVEALFWFHPLVWWLGARLMEERERACDEEVLLMGSDPEVYAEGIVKICELYLESPLPCVAGVTGSNLKKRIEAIMSNPSLLRLNFVQIIALVTAGAGALAAPIIVGILNAPAIRAQSPQAKTQSSVQSGMKSTAKFEVASLRPCKVEDEGDGDWGGKRATGGAGRGRVRWDPGRLDEECQTLFNLIRDAYLAYPDGKPWRASTRAQASADSFGAPSGRGCTGCGQGVPPVSHRLFEQPIKGTPAWINFDRYTIDAKADGPASPEMMRGPMMQSLLEDRFKLKIHRETREVPVYELTVAKGGPKLRVAQPGSCVIDPPSSAWAPGQPVLHFCGGFIRRNNGIDMNGATIAQLCSQFSSLFDRDVIDKTGIAGIFDFHFDAFPVELTADDPTAHAPADRLPGPPPPLDAPATFRAFRAAFTRLGLKLEAAMGPGVFLVIDHVERPSGN
jgi:bla regulator protein BlaR1